MSLLNILLDFSVTLSKEFIIIILLFIYIFYLNIQLTKKNVLLKSLYEKFKTPNSELEKKDILQFLENIKNPNYSGIVTKDKFLDNEINNFLFENEKEIKLFLHYTSSKKIANKIIKEGFKFVNSFYKTAEYIYNDELYLIQRHHEHKQFGDYVMVICISKEIYNRYSEELSKISARNIAVEQILTERPPILDENAEEIYILPNQFVKGYFNYKDGIITVNANFDSNYHSKIFDENLEKLKRDLK